MVFDFANAFLTGVYGFVIAGAFVMCCVAVLAILAVIVNIGKVFSMHNNDDDA